MPDSTTAQAHPNFALIKYWGKQDAPGNLPATPNLSITLSELATTTTIETGEQDEMWLNDVPTQDAKVAQFLTHFREAFAIPQVRIHSNNNFPTAAGLASSASGFAALVCALNAHFNLNLDRTAMSGWARQGSASAARSLFGGFVSLSGKDWQAKQIAPAEHWPLNTVVAVTSTQAKSTSSTEGMQRSRATSPFYAAWVEHAQSDFDTAVDAINVRDFNKLADVAEHNCLKMHSLMLEQPAGIGLLELGNACLYAYRARAACWWGRCVLYRGCGATAEGGLFATRHRHGGTRAGSHTRRECSTSMRAGIRCGCGNHTLSTTASPLSVQAPGKVVLWGEYAVLAGAPAAVAAIDHWAEVAIQSRQAGWQFSATGLQAPGVYSQAQFTQAPIASLGEAILRTWGYDAYPATSAEIEIDTRAFYTTTGGQAPTKLGIGSSAAVCVALYAGLARLLGHTPQMSEAMRIHTRLARWQR